MSNTDRWDGKYRRFKPTGNTGKDRMAVLAEDPHGQFMLIDDHDRLMDELRADREALRRSYREEMQADKQRISELNAVITELKEAFSEPTDFAVQYRGVTLSSWPSEELANAALMIEAHRQGDKAEHFTIKKLWAMP